MALPAMFLLAACGTPPSGGPDDSGTKTTAQVQQAASATQPKETAERKAGPAKAAPPVAPAGESSKDDSFEKVDWGREITLDAVVAMAKRGQIQDIQWHVMPNVIRIQAADGRIFHIKNENKGVDLRKTLIDAGVRIGKGGIPFRYKF
jgi:hypothetical protein